MVHLQNVTTLAFLFIIVGTFSLQAQQTHIVDLSGTGDFTTLHAAVAAASAGDTIRVQPDQYAFTVDLGKIEINKKLVIIGSGYMPVAEGGTELVDITGQGYFDLTGSADGTVIQGFRIQGATGFLTTEGGTSKITIEENLFITGYNVLNLNGTQDSVRSNIFVSVAQNAINNNATNTIITNNLFSNGGYTGINTTVGSGVIIAHNLFLKGVYNGFGAINVTGSPEIYSNGFISCYYAIHGSTYITNNGFYGVTSVGLNPVEAAPEFVGFDIENETLDIETIDEDQYDLRLMETSEWINAGRTGTLYLDTDGSRSDIGIYSGPMPFEDGRGAPTVPVVIDFQVSPTTVSPSGTITIKATGRIGGN